MLRHQICCHRNGRVENGWEDARICMLYSRVSVEYIYVHQVTVLAAEEVSSGLRIALMHNLRTKARRCVQHGVGDPRIDDRDYNVSIE